MCGRFSLGSMVRAAQLFDIPSAGEIPPRYNIAPTQDVPALVRNRETGARELRLVRWGLVPAWAKDPAIGNRLINARAETVAAKPAFRRPFRERRCAILADGFYEWAREGGRKQPYHIRLLDAQPFAFAGLWDRWQPRDAPALDTCAIVTTASNDLIRPLHDRMPVILAPASCDLWLDPALQEVERLQTLLAPYPADAMVAYPVSAKVNNPGNDAPDVLEPLAR